MGSDNKAAIFFGNLEKSLSFDRRLREIRKQFGIAPSGFKSTKKGSEWLWKLQDDGTDAMFKDDGRYEKWKAYDRAKQDLLNEFSIPPSLATTLDGKILLAKSVQQNLDLSFGCVLIDPRDKNYSHTFQAEEFWSASRLPHATLLIHAGVTKSGIATYVRNNWGKIQELTAGSTHIKRPYKHRKQSRDEVVFELCSLSREELGLKRGEYKLTKIKQILREEYDELMSEKNIERIYKEQRRLRH